MGAVTKRILVTGGAGFIGVHTVGRLAADGATVLVVDDGRHACGEALPPNVDPCIPNPIAAAAFSLHTSAPSGSPQARGLAATITSGRFPCSNVVDGPALLAALVVLADDHPPVLLLGPPRCAPHRGDRHCAPPEETLPRS